MRVFLQGWIQIRTAWGGVINHWTSYHTKWPPLFFSLERVNNNYVVYDSKRTQVRTGKGYRNERWMKKRLLSNVFRVKFH